MVACKDCGKEFEHRESMEQHYSALHAKQQPVSPPPAYKKSKKKPIFMISGIIIVLIIGYFVLFNNGSEEKPLITAGDEISINLDEVPKRPIHWHPTLTVIMKGARQTIPANLGGTAGRHLPIHTHDTSGTLHVENSRPTPETVTLGYFFDKIWRKTFNSNCILDACNGPDGSLIFTVNGEPNFKFDKYVLKDRDNVVIEFSDTPAVITEESVPEVKEFSMTAKQWEFIPSTITVNQGDTVKLSVRSLDVSHGIALPDFGIREFLRPGKSTEIEFVADKKGTFSFFCSVSCGIGHGNMRGTLIVN